MLLLLMRMMSSGVDLPHIEIINKIEDSRMRIESTKIENDKFRGRIELPISVGAAVDYDD